MALVSLAILSLSAACSEKPVEKPKSRFTQEGLNAISTACGLPPKSLTLEGTNSVHFAAAVLRDYEKLNCVQTKIRETYYPGSKTDQQEGDNAQTH